MLPIARKDLPEKAPANETDYPFVIACALKRELGESRHAIKKLARWTGASERTAQNWLGGVRGPSGEHLVALAKHSPAVHAAYLTMTGRTVDAAATIDALVTLLHEALEKLGANKLP